MANKRRGNATKGAVGKAWRWFRRLPTKVQVGAWIALGLLLVVSAATSPEEASKDEGSQASEQTPQAKTADEPKPKPQPFRATDAQVVAFFEDEMGDTPDFANGKRVRGSSCNRITCLVLYNADMEGCLSSWGR